jgi:pimeloyl-ACP methyl ester carboxylesterase
MPRIAIHGQDLHYLDCGAGFPVLFGGSYLWNAVMWAPQVEGLSSRYRCIVPELWGHGKSGAIPEVPYSRSKLAGDMRGLVDALGLEQFAIVGLSVGGIWGIEMALACPARVRALVLMDTAAAKFASKAVPSSPATVATAPSNDHTSAPDVRSLVMISASTQPIPR